MSGPTTLLPFQPATMTSAQLAAVSFLARYPGRTHSLYAYQLREWFSRCESNGLEPLVGIQRAHVEPTLRGLGDRGLMDSSVVTVMHAVRGYFRFAHIDGLLGSGRLRPATQGPPRRVPHPRQGPARADPVPPGRPHHRRPPRRPGLPARHQRPAHLGGGRRADKPATMPLTVPVLRVLEACRGERIGGPLVLRPVSGNPIDRRDAHRMVARIATVAAIPRHISPHSLRHAAITNALDAGVPLRDAQILARHADPRTTEHDDRARGNLDRHGVHFLTAYVAGA